MVEKLSFNLSNFVHQEFPFTLKLIEFINETADAETKQKLDRCCKYFYKEAPFLIIDTLEFNKEKQRIENEAYGGCIDFIDVNELEMFLEKIDNVWVTKNMKVSIDNELDDLDIEFTDRIIRCDAAEVSIFNANWPFNDFKLLTKSGIVEYLDLSTSSIVADYDDSNIPLEDVLARVPNARIIRMLDCHITPQTMTKLLSIPWKNTITELSLNNVDGPICVDLFFDFVKNFVGPDVSIHVQFKDETDTFQMLYNQKVIDSGENMPTFGNVDYLVKKKTKVQHLLSWMASFASIIEIIQGEFADPFKKPSAPKKFKKVTYNDENAERQYFAFPYPHMCYIRENADAEVWKKLEQTCKFFFQKNPYYIIDDVLMDGKVTLTVDNKKVVVQRCNVATTIYKPFWITNSISGFHPFKVELNLRNEATQITIGKFSTRMKQFKSICGPGLVKQWDSIEAYISYNDVNKIISLIDLLIHLPNVETIRANARGIQPPYPNKPIILPQSNKIKQLYLQFLHEPILADSLFHVLTKSLAPKARVELDFKRLANNEMDVTQFKAQLKSKLDTWKPQIERPTVKIVF